MQSPYHIYSLSPNIVDLRNLTLWNIGHHPPPKPPTPPPHDAEDTSPSSYPSGKLGSRACNVCQNATFKDVEDQRTHFRSDWHRYNVKTRLTGGKPVSEVQFAALVDGLEDSLSGSASSSESDDSEESDAVQTLVRRNHASQNRSPSPSSAPSIPKSAVIWFHSPPNAQIGIYRTIFPSSLSPDEYAQELQDMQRARDGGRTWAVFMTAGGHFAGAILRVARGENEEQEAPAKKGKQKKPKPDIEVLKHKGFHRYTTRRKQGGSQGLNDTSKNRAAKSAGAQLRRYGEQSLRDDIRNLLTEWAEDIEDCERIWLRASVSNRRIFMDYDSAVLTKTDERLRTFPFPTRRPTQSEVMRCVGELTRAKVSHFTEDELRAQDEAFLASLPKPKPKPVPVHPASVSPAKEVPSAPKLSKEEEVRREKWSRLLDMTEKGRLDALKMFWEREGDDIAESHVNGGNVIGIDVRVPEWSEHADRTLLQVAARAGAEGVVEWLLETCRADPTLDVPSSLAHDDSNLEPEVDGEADAEQGDETKALPATGRRTAYDLAQTRGVRNVFRRSAGAHADWWDWLGAGRVPSVLSKEMEEGRDGKKKDRRKGLKDKIREREAKAKEKQGSQAQIADEEPTFLVAPPKGREGAQRLGGPGSTASADGIAGLTPEMRANVERERRARAAEARLKALSKGA